MSQLEKLLFDILRVVAPLYFLEWYTFLFIMVWVSSVVAPLYFLEWYTLWCYINHIIVVVAPLYFLEWYTRERQKPLKLRVWGAFDQYFLSLYLPYHRYFIAFYKLTIEISSKTKIKIYVDIFKQSWYDRPVLKEVWNHKQTE